MANFSLAFPPFQLLKTATFSLANSRIASTIKYFYQLYCFVRLFFFGIASCLLNLVVKQFKAVAKAFLLVNKYYFG